MKRFDERDTIFARMNYPADSEEYADYYQKNPDKKAIDDMLRSLPNIGEKGTVTFDPINSPIAEAGFKFLADIRNFAEGSVKSTKIEIDPQEMTSKIKKLGKYFGAKLVGIAEMQDYHYYSNRGRHLENYGDKIEIRHKYGIVFAVEMDKEMINRAPQVEELLAVTKGYVDGAIIGMWLSYYLRELGYDARNHMDGNYLLIAPLVAQDAGLGEIGRSGILITKEFGPRVRLGVVTTNMPLVADMKEEFGIKDFCTLCGKCADSCPSKAISSDDIKTIDGELRWRIIPEKCHMLWRRIGTDCGVCLSSCPFSQNVSLELINSMQDSNKVKHKILKEHESKHGNRAYINEPLDIIK